MSESPLPEEIKQKINDTYYSGEYPYQSLRTAAEFGYQLALKELEEKDKRIKELESQNNDLALTALQATRELSSLKSRVLQITEDTWNKCADELKRDIAQTFLNPSNQDKADKESDRHVFQALGETIQNFPNPDKSIFINNLRKELNIQS